MPEPERVSGIERAAILLLSLGEQNAAQLLRHLEPRDVQRLGATMANLPNVSRDGVTQVLAEFVDSVEQQTALGVGTEEYIRKMLEGAIGEQKADSVVSRILKTGRSKGLDSLRWMERERIAELIRDEHPQIIAIILAYLDSDQAAAVLNLLPESTRADLAVRIARLDGIPPAALQELDHSMDKHASGKSHAMTARAGGIRAVAEILNQMESDVELELLARIVETDENLGREIEEQMFVFEDLAQMDDRGIQTLLREVTSETLLVALKGSGEFVKEKIFSNMSKRAAEMLRDDLDAQGPLRLSEVEAAQKEVLATARKLAESGDLVLGGKGSKAYV
jgi:flagellar motor switch protein FliG